MKAIEAVQEIYGFEICNHEWGNNTVKFHNSDEIIKYGDFVKLNADEKEKLHVSEVLIGCLKCGQPFNN